MVWLSLLRPAYFDNYRPRELGLRPARKELLRQIADRSLFLIPTW